MTGLALWLIVVAVLDLLRGTRPASGVGFVLALGGAGALSTVVLWIALGPTGAGWVAWPVAAVSIVGWLLGSAVATARFGAGGVLRLPVQVSGPVAAAAAFASWGVGVTVLLLAGPAAGTAPGLTALLARSGLSQVPGDRVLLITALILIQISTANVLVRLLLDLVGVPASDNEKKLRGGRVLGPMERLLILGMGIGGSLLGAAIVVAAKALLRFPELRVPRAGDPGYGGASDVTEYFLVGSFASWLVALGSVGLVALGG